MYSAIPSTNALVVPFLLSFDSASIVISTECHKNTSGAHNGVADVGVAGVGACGEMLRDVLLGVLFGFVCKSVGVDDCLVLLSSADGAAFFAEPTLSDPPPVIVIEGEFDDLKSRP
jgi:hypothetical protein